jgi:hypothetical protein
VINARKIVKFLSNQHKENLFSAENVFKKRERKKDIEKFEQKIKNNLKIKSSF